MFQFGPGGTYSVLKLNCSLVRCARFVITGNDGLPLRFLVVWLQAPLTSPSPQFFFFFFFGGGGGGFFPHVVFLGHHMSFAHRHHGRFYPVCPWYTSQSDLDMSAEWPICISSFIPRRGYSPPTDSVLYTANKLQSDRYILNWGSTGMGTVSHI